MRGMLAGRKTLDAVATIAVIVAAGAIVWSVFRGRGSGTETGLGVPIPRTPLSIGDIQRGRTSAKVGIIEYSDFQCPFCARFASETLPSLISRYVDTGKVLFSFRYFPLVSVHPMALPAAEAAECAELQGRFWPMHDILYLSQDQLGPNLFLKAAEQGGLDSEAFKACLNTQAEAPVQADVTLGKTIGVTSTPTFFIGVVESRNVRVQRVIVGAQPLEKFASILEDLLK